MEGGGDSQVSLEDVHPADGQAERGPQQEEDGEHVSGSRTLDYE